MKSPLSWIFALSLAGNILLGCWLAQPRAKAHPKSEPIAGANPTKEQLPAAKVTWTVATGSLTPEYLSDLIAQIRAAGVPPRLARGIVTRLIQDQFSARRADVIYPPGRPFFRQGLANLDGEGKKTLADLDAEQQQWLRQLFGSETTTDDPETQRMLAMRYKNFVSPEKFAAVAKIWADYDNLRTKLAAERDAGAVGPTISAGAPSDRRAAAFDSFLKQTALLEQEQRADLARLLTPDELATHNLLHSESSERVKVSTRLLDLSENEFRSLYALQSVYDEKHAMAGVGAPMLIVTTPEKLPDLNLLLEGTREILGDARFGQYMAAAAYSFSDLQKAATAHGLAVPAAYEAWKIQRDAYAEMTRIANDTTLSATERNSSLTRWRADALAKTIAVLGPAATETYQRSITNTMVPRGGSTLVMFPVLQPIRRPAPPR